jgi:hypothetical protein
MVSKPEEEKVCWIARDRCQSADLRKQDWKGKIKSGVMRPSEQADMPFHKGGSTVTRCYVRMRKQNVTKIYPFVFSSQRRARGGRVVEWE